MLVVYQRGGLRPPRCHLQKGLALFNILGAWFVICVMRITVAPDIYVVVAKKTTPLSMGLQRPSAKKAVAAVEKELPPG